MRLIIKELSKERSTEIIHELDDFIDESKIIDWEIDKTEEQNYRSTNQILGENVSIEPYYLSSSLCFSFLGKANREVKFLNLIKFLEVIFEYFADDMKAIEITDI